MNRASLTNRAQDLRCKRGMMIYDPPRGSEKHKKASFLFPDPEKEKGSGLN
jgi:hypothetical protein